MIQTKKIALVVLMAIAVVGAMGIGMGIQSAHANNGVGKGGIPGCTPNCPPNPGMMGDKEPVGFPDDKQGDAHSGARG